MTPDITPAMKLTKPSVITKGFVEKFHAIDAVVTSTANIIAVLLTAPSKVILSERSDDLVLKADDLIKGLPDLPKVLRAE
jgi:hypothetical protein